MWAIRQHAFGGPDELRCEEVADPQPAAREVRIRVESAGVHLVDTSIRRGDPGPFPRPDLPMTPGREVAGVVDAVGAAADENWRGQRVVAHLGVASGGYAELAVAAADTLHAVPDTLDADAAVAMIGTGRTTVAILDLAEPRRGDVVLVTAAAGGIGTLLVQAGRNAGATVVRVAGGASRSCWYVTSARSSPSTTTSPGWADRVRSLQGERPVTTVFDGVGGSIGPAALELLGPGGRLVLYGWSSGTPTELDETELRRRSISVARLQRPTDMKALETRALAAASARWLQSVVGHRYRLCDAAAAHRAIETRATFGKTVLRP
jgi:NADPH2:quinone reductase